MPRAVVIAASPHADRPLRRRAGGRAPGRPRGARDRRGGPRAGVDAAQIEDVYFGCANQAGEDNRNVARMALLLAGLPDSVAGVTVNRLCASGLAAVVSAGHAIVAGDGDLFVAGGVESMTRAPLVTAKPDAAFPRGDRTLYDTTLGWRFPNPRLAERFPLESMGETGENVAERWGVSRADQDAFALPIAAARAAAADAGRFDDELVPVGDVVRDEHPRPDTTLEKLAALKPAFRDGGTVTAGNASRDQRRRRGAGDGVARSKARELGVEPLGAFVGRAVAGVDPRVMGIGPIPAMRKLLERAGLAVGRARSRRAERGVRVAEPRRASASSGSTRPRQRERRRDRARPSARDERRAARRHAAPRAPPARRPLRAGDDVHRRRPGPGGPVRASVVRHDATRRRRRTILRSISSRHARSFPGLREATFLDSALVGIAPAQAAHAVEDVARRGAGVEEHDASEHRVALDKLRDGAPP